MHASDNHQDPWTRFEEGLGKNAANHQALSPLNFLALVQYAESGQHDQRLHLVQIDLHDDAPSPLSLAPPGLAFRRS